MDSFKLAHMHGKAIIATHSVLVLRDAIGEMVDLGCGIPGSADRYCAEIHNWLRDELRTIEEEEKERFTES